MSEIALVYETVLNPLRYSRLINDTHCLYPLHGQRISKYRIFSLDYFSCVGQPSIATNTTRT